MLLIVIAGTTSAAPEATAQDIDSRVRAATDRLAPSIIDVRHRLHQNPELSNREFETAKLIAGQLRQLGIEVRTGIARTGVVGILHGGRPGPMVAVRADMDALPVTEDTPYAFKSTVRTQYNGLDVGVSHACGHDIHVAVQLGVASVLAGMREEIAGSVMFIFQPAEEGPPAGEEGGAALMLKEGIFSNTRPAAIFGLHAFSELDVGKLGYIEGPMLASATGWRATVFGKQAHGARPNESIDPIVTASQVVLALQTIRARNLSPFAPTVVTVGVMRGGERGNIIPAEVRMEGTIRTFDDKVTDTIEQRMREIFDGITRSAGGSYEIQFERGYPVTSNDVALARRVRPIMERIVGRDNVVDNAPTTGAEDFGLFAMQTPGFFYRLGTVKPGTTSGGHHTPNFMADDASIPVGMRVMTGLVLDYLGVQ
jgi:amidohydrolase